MVPQANENSARFRAENEVGEEPRGDFERYVSQVAEYRVLLLALVHLSIDWVKNGI